MDNNSIKQRNLFVEFQQISGDFLKALGELSMKADTGRPVMIQHKELRDLVSTIELFWDQTENIFKHYEERLQLLRLLGVNDKAKAIILTEELKSTYNELYKVRNKIPETVIELMKKTKLLTKEDLNKNVELRNNPDNKHGQENRPA